MRYGNKADRISIGNNFYVGPITPFKPCAVVSCPER